MCEKNRMKITESVVYLGCDDKEIELFENQYFVPNGVSYNSYLILDEKIAVMDTVDPRKGQEWLKNVEKALEGRIPDYLIINHMEPDHAGNIQNLVEKYPSIQLVGNAKTFAMLPQFFSMDVSKNSHCISEGDTLCLGSHVLQFFMAPMIHWPEVMVAYEQTEKILFSADAFGKFGTLDTKEDWTQEARRYFINIVGKYGVQVQALLKKAAALDIEMICPLHGPILKENLDYYIGKYDTWSSYQPEEEGVVIACASIHGNTKRAMERFSDILKEAGAKNVLLYDLSKADMSEVIANAYRYDTLVTACSTYDASLFPCMEDFLYHLKIKNFQKRRVALIENGSWAAVAGKLMKKYFEEMKHIEFVEPLISIKSSMSQENEVQLKLLAEELLKKQ